MSHECPHGRPVIDCDDNAMSCGCCGTRVDANGEAVTAGRCRECPMESPQKHACRTPEQAEPCGRHGPAVDDCREDEEGYFVVGNDEYSSYANFCPFCGAKAPSPIPTKP